MNELAKFPFKLFWKFFAGLFVLLSLLCALVLYAIQGKYGLPSQVIADLAIYFITGTALISGFFAYRWASPVYRLTLKAIRISSKKLARELGIYQDEDDEDWMKDPSGEFAILEGILNRIAKKMKGRKEKLIREQEELQALISSVQEGILSVLGNGEVAYFNSQFAASFLDSNQIKKGHLILEDIFRQPDVLAAFREVLNSGRSNKVQVQLSTRLEHLPRHFVISLSPLRRPWENSFYGAIAVFHDITEFKNIEQARIDFVNNASHELRTPLTSMRGYLDTLNEDIQKGDFELAGKFTGIISGNLNRLIELVNDLLSIASLESRPEIKIEPIHTLHVTANVVNELQLLAREKNHRIVIKGESGEFNADSQKVEQVLRNLISNAIKYIPKDGLIEVVWEDGRNGQMYLKVKDNGPGIPVEHHARLFDRFYRIDKGRTRDAGGTGLGLAIVKHIMQSHGGQVDVKSTMGEGTEFVCTFPIHPHHS